jgi:hypothetical protein
MSRKIAANKIYEGLKVNERLLVSGKLEQFDTAARKGNRRKMINMLQTLALTETYATRWVDTLLCSQTYFDV